MSIAVSFTDRELIISALVMRLSVLVFIKQKEIVLLLLTNMVNDVTFLSDENSTTAAGLYGQFMVN